MVGEEGGGGGQGTDGDREIPEACKTTVEALEKEISGIEWQPKEAKRRLTVNQERSALTTMEEKDALIRGRQRLPGPEKADGQATGGREAGGQGG